ncbi:MAG TPA: acyl-CoA thioesterase [Geminicoccaceae bacterium]|nr:acyl-CoA thioesterase [Geminicoccaceae bacterium]
MSGDTRDPDPDHPCRLREADRARFGVDEPGWACAIRAEVRWCDVDAFGHANHLSFLNWFQDARNAYLELVGLPRLSATTPGPVLTRVEARYLRPLAYADRLLVTARTASLRRRSFVMEYAAWREGCRARCSALCVLMINATGEKTPVPEGVRAAMIRLDAPTVEA